ncbi:hypothetical protein WL19_15715 [Burkholderia ubonensis]|nr:hypothetical protein WL19_15715 [Burkholderia ubonensis]
MKDERIPSCRVPILRLHIGMLLSPVHSKPGREMKIVFGLTGMQQLEVLILANQLLQFRTRTDAMTGQLVINRWPGRTRTCHDVPPTITLIWTSHCCGTLATKR